MKTFKIKIDKTPITDKEILKNKPSFSEVAKNFKGFKTPFFKTPWFIGGTSGIATIGLVASMFFYFSNNKLIESDKNNVSIDSLNETNKFITNPVKNVALPYEEFILENKNGAEFKAKTGTGIIIPKIAFTHLDGTIVNGPVKVKFREMHDPYDLFISGVPMQYDSANTSRTFESAGMFEIRAFDEESELKLAPGKTIHVDLVTFDNDPKFNFYYLDTNKRNWVYINKSDFDKLSDVKNNNDFTIQYEKNDNNKTSDLQVSKFIMPQKSKIAKNTFKIDFDKKVFPELGIYENVLFEVNTEKSKFDSKLFEVKWNDIRLRSSKTKGNYLMVLSRPDSSVYLYVIPVFASKDYEKAITAYEKLKTSKDKTQPKQKDLSSQDLLARQNVTASKQVYNNRTSIKGIRSVDISMMGYYNHDYPMPIQDYTFEPQFSSNDQLIQPASIHAVDVNINAIFNFNPADDEIRCNRKSEIVLWIVGKDNKIGIVINSDFIAATKNTRKPKFQVSMLEPHDGLEQLKKYIRI